MRRREFLRLVGGVAAAWPVVARAQQLKPVVGILNSTSPEPTLMASFYRGLKAEGFVEHQNLTVEYRAAEGRYELLPALAAQLIDRRVAVLIATGGDISTLAAKAATTTIPIVFTTGSDPVKAGIVASLNRPGGNITGATFFARELAAKRLELLHELVPTARLVSVLVNPTNPAGASDTDEIEAVAQARGLRARIHKVSNQAELNSAFANPTEPRPDMLFVGADAFFVSRHNNIVALAARIGVAAIYPRLEYVVAGGLISYSTRVEDTYRQVGSYAGRILKGEKPADLPVQQPTKFELVINLKTAKTLGLTIPPTLLGRADEVIE